MKDRRDSIHSLLSQAAYAVSCRNYEVAEISLSRLSALVPYMTSCEVDEYEQYVKATEGCTSKVHSVAWEDDYTQSFQ